MRVVQEYRVHIHVDLCTHVHADMCIRVCVEAGSSSSRLYYLSRRVPTGCAFLQGILGSAW